MSEQHAGATNAAFSLTHGACYYRALPGKSRAPCAARRIIHRDEERTHEGNFCVRGAVPKHVGFIPDGNRRWAAARGLCKEEGYAFGVAPGVQLIEQCKAEGIEEVSV